MMMQVSFSAKQLMYRLLNRDPKSRLGSREGANEIKNHPFFRGVNWALVRCTVTWPNYCHIMFNSILYSLLLLHVWLVQHSCVGRSLLSLMLLSSTQLKEKRKPILKIKCKRRWTSSEGLYIHIQEHMHFSVLLQISWRFNSISHSLNLVNEANQLSIVWLFINWLYVIKFITKDITKYTYQTKI